MNENMKLICETCLSSDRRLIATSRILYILEEIRYEELNNKLICWECHSIILKFHTFKLQARNTQVALSEKFQDLKPLTKLLQSTKACYDFEFECKYDLLTNEINTEEIEPKIKYEDEIISMHDLPTVDLNDFEDRKLTIFADSLGHKEELFPKKKYFSVKKLSNKKPLQQLLEEKIPKKKPLTQAKKLKKIKDIDSNVKEKFKTVLLTKEEMLLSREEKRNHPNYKKIPFKCDTCVLGFTKKENYDLHFAKKHDEAIGPHTCDVCSTRFASTRSLATHRALHFTHYACSLCVHKTTSLTAAGNHCRDKHARDDKHNIHCKQCIAVFRTSEELLEHTKLEHVLYCKDCGEKFKGKHTLRAHRVRIHGVKREFACEICKRSFVTKSRLESHVALHSPSLARRLAFCADCDVQYKNIQVYRNHLQNSKNHAQNRYQCPECNKKFASKIYRTKHYNFYHLKKSKYRCDSCNKLFISEWRLKNHRQKHHGLARSRDHECKECGKKFYTSATLAIHSCRHAASPRLLCALCGARYRQPAALYTHERRAHKQTNIDKTDTGVS